jgi:hypothetical protein
VFIVRADGTMKQVIFPPEESFEYSEKLLELFAVLGVTNPDELLNDITVH